MSYRFSRHHGDLALKELGVKSTQLPDHVFSLLHEPQTMCLYGSKMMILFIFMMLSSLFSHPLNSWDRWRSLYLKQLWTSKQRIIPKIMPRSFVWAFSFVGGMHLWNCKSNDSSSRHWMNKTWRAGSWWICRSGLVDYTFVVMTFSFAYQLQFVSLSVFEQKT